MLDLDLPEPQTGFADPEDEHVLQVTRGLDLLTATQAAVDSR